MVSVDRCDVLIPVCKREGALSLMPQSDMKFHLSIGCCRMRAQDLDECSTHALPRPHPPRRLRKRSGDYKNPPTWALCSRTSQMSSARLPVERIDELQDTAASPFDSRITLSSGHGLLGTFLFFSACRILHCFLFMAKRALASQHVGVMIDDSMVEDGEYRPSSSVDCQSSSGRRPRTRWR